MDAIEIAFGHRAAYGQIIKSYRGDPGPRTERRYSPGVVVAVSTNDVFGHPSKVCTSHVERANPSVRMNTRRFTRLTNGFSKKLRNHRAAVSLYVAHYNLCRVHEALRITPAMAIGVTDHVWSVGELIEASAHPLDTSPKPRRFGVIDGGLS